MKTNRRLTLLGLAALCVAAAAPALAAPAADRCAGSRDLRIVNGRIHTMDARDSIVSRITIREGRFVADAAAGPCTRTIDVKGRAVVP